MAEVSNAWRWVAGAAVVAAVIGAALYVNRRPPPPQPQAQVQALAPAPAAPAVQHPIADAGVEPAAGAPLPALEQSDAALLQALSDLAGSDALAALLEPEYLIARIVATVDNLPRRAVAVRMLPTKPVAGAFLALEVGGTTVIAPQNAARYDAHMAVLQAVDAQRLVALYLRWYPLFQQAYRELGYPDAEFNDRLVEVIDHLLAAPAVEEPLAVTRPKVLYEYADPELEARSAGERLLFRIGSANAAKVKAKLGEIRAALVGRKAPAAATQPPAGGA